MSEHVTFNRYRDDWQYPGHFKFRRKGCPADSAITLGCRAQRGGRIQRIERALPPTWNHEEFLHRPARGYTSAAVRMHRARSRRGGISPGSCGGQRRSRHNLRPLGQPGHKFGSAPPDARKDSVGQFGGEDHPRSLRTSGACPGRFAEAFAIEVRASDKASMFNSLDEQIKRDNNATSTVVLISIALFGGSLDMRIRAVRNQRELVRLAQLLKLYAHCRLKMAGLMAETAHGSNASLDLEARVRTGCCHAQIGRRICRAIRRCRTG